ncbi:MAG: hypothetical protein H7138_22280 [Myxococcales bacterium]|nr:hypothetical protein [Myxococcales bacterium]
MARYAFGLVIGSLALWAGCTRTLTDEAIQVCYPLCRCNDVPLPAEQEACTTGCIANFERNPLGEDCVTCVVEHANRCASLVDTCTPICTQPALADHAAVWASEVRMH